MGQYESELTFLLPCDCEYSLKVRMWVCEVLHFVEPSGTHASWRLLVLNLGIWKVEHLSNNEVHKLEMLQKNNFYLDWVKTEKKVNF